MIQQTAVIRFKTESRKVAERRKLRAQCRILKSESREQRKE
jgi:hypothetical protein